MATVEMSFTPLPVHVRTARLVATAVARRSGVQEALLDEVRLAVGEACSRAVEAHRAHCPAEPVRIEPTGTTSMRTARRGREAETVCLGRATASPAVAFPVTASPARPSPLTAFPLAASLVAALPQRAARTI